MPSQPATDTRKLVAFIALIVTVLTVIWRLNLMVRERDASVSVAGNAALRKALERLIQHPTLSMTMVPATENERPMRHMNATLIPPVDVLVLGQSDADHMSQTFFKDDVVFYNGWISISYYLQQLEVFEDVALAHRAPRLVLLDVRTGYVLSDDPEPTIETPANDPRWKGVPPYRLGQAEPAPWYTSLRDVDSLLSLQQTERTLAWILSETRDGRSPAESGPAIADVDTGAPFRDVASDVPSNMYRWLADGSRVVPGEVSGMLPPPRAEFYLDRTDRHPNDARLAVLEWLVRQMLTAGSKVIMYSPPMSPRVFADGGLQASNVRDAATRIRQVADKLDVDYCDLTVDAGPVGCREIDFSDETHISRHCNAGVVNKLAHGCAPRTAPLLSKMLRPEILAP